MKVNSCHIATKEYDEFCRPPNRPVGGVSGLSKEQRPTFFAHQDSTVRECLIAASRKRLLGKNGDELAPPHTRATTAKHTFKQDNKKHIKKEENRAMPGQK